MDIICQHITLMASLISQCIVIGCVVQCIAIISKISVGVFIFILLGFDLDRNRFDVEAASSQVAIHAQMKAQ